MATLAKYSLGVVAVDVALLARGLLLRQGAVGEGHRVEGHARVVLQRGVALHLELESRGQSRSIKQEHLKLLNYLSPVVGTGPIIR